MKGEELDIFTTQLTRVVPSKLKPESLKVKALIKEPATNELTDDPDHLENHEYYFEKEEHDNEQASEHPTYERRELIKSESEADEEQDSQKNNEPNPHLDIYV